MNSDTVNIDLIDMVVLHEIVVYRDTEIKRLMDQGYSKDEAGRAVSALGIAQIWGNKSYMKTSAGKVITHEGKFVPDGLVNRFIMEHNLGTPLMHPEQFYRIAEKLARAGFLIGGRHQFVATDEGYKFVVMTLNQFAPQGWPRSVPVTAGVPDYSKRTA